MLIGEKIRNLRESKGISRYRLCKDTGIPYTTLNDVESGKVKSITLENAVLISKALKISIEILSA